MARFFVTCGKGAYALVEHTSPEDLALDLNNGPLIGGTFRKLLRPDGKTVLIDPKAVVLIQAPVPHNDLIKED